jgi:hypothetical protein
MLLKNTFELFDRDGGGEIETQEVLFTVRISVHGMSCASFAPPVDKSLAAGRRCLPASSMQHD